MNSTNDHDPRGPRRFSEPGPYKCFVCSDPIGEQCFCKIHRKDGGPTMLCCPDCTIQYLYSARTPADEREQELRVYEKSTHFFIGEDEPWS